MLSPHCLSQFCLLKRLPASPSTLPHFVLIHPDMRLSISDFLSWLLVLPTCTSHISSSEHFQLSLMTNNEIIPVSNLLILFLERNVTNESIASEHLLIFFNNHNFSAWSSTKKTIYPPTCIINLFPHHSITKPLMSSQYVQHKQKLPCGLMLTITCIVISDMTVDWTAAPHWRLRELRWQKQIIFSKLVLHVITKETQLNGRKITCDCPWCESTLQCRWSKMLMDILKLGQEICTGAWLHLSIIAISLIFTRTVVHILQLLQSHAIKNLWCFY